MRNRDSPISFLSKTGQVNLQSTSDNSGDFFLHVFQDGRQFFQPFQNWQWALAPALFRSRSMKHARLLVSSIWFVVLLDLEIPII